jgi:hypothetical protein
MGNGQTETIPIVHDGVMYVVMAELLGEFPEIKTLRGNNAIHVFALP